MAQVRDVPGDQVAELMTELAPLFRHIEPLFLTPHVLRDAVAVWPGTRKLARGRHLEQRIPVVGGIDTSGRFRGPGEGRVQGHLGTGANRDRTRIDQPVATHPHVVDRVWQFG